MQQNNECLRMDFDFYCSCHSRVSRLKMIDKSEEKGAGRKEKPLDFRSSLRQGYGAAGKSGMMTGLK
ncbi:MAG: hypothetical protein JW927_15390 [Deltaproteobacteria bacterium]|nr:hypothetical protein [Deltaproteobacteria bacterium]